MRKLSHWPKQNVLTWKGYDINKYSFYMKSHDDKSKMQNGGISLDTNFEHFCSAFDNIPILTSMPYFGVIENIWELDYSLFIVLVFK